MYDARACIAYAMSAVHVLLSRIYTDFILILYLQILSRFCPKDKVGKKHFIQILSRFYFNSIQIS